LATLNHAMNSAEAKHEVRDGVVASERTGRYHWVVQRAFGAAGFETRVLHPLRGWSFREEAQNGPRP
jgi:hypothetical protein